MDSLCKVRARTSSRKELYRLEMTGKSVIGTNAQAIVKGGAKADNSEADREGDSGGDEVIYVAAAVVGRDAINGI